MFFDVVNDRVSGIELSVFQIQLLELNVFKIQLLVYGQIDLGDVLVFDILQCFVIDFFWIFIDCVWWIGILKLVMILYFLIKDNIMFRYLVIFEIIIIYIY